MVATMVTRKRLRAVLNALALYTIAALAIGYFSFNAYSGNRGLRSRQDLDQQIVDLSAELEALEAGCAGWDHRGSLLRPESIDPDMLDERAWVLLNYAAPRELTFGLQQSRSPRPMSQSGRTIPSRICQVGSV